MVRVGVCLGTADDAAASARLLKVALDLLAKVLSMSRLLVIALPALAQCLYLQSVQFSDWVPRVAVTYGLIVGACFVLVPEQLYDGMGLSSVRWLFEEFYPGIVFGTGSLTEGDGDAAERLLGGRHRVAALHGLEVQLRWHGTDQYLCFTDEGWGVTGDEALAATLLVQQVRCRDRPVPDTYQFRICEPAGEWHQSWVGFRPVNHLGYGGWLGAFPDASKACPYKVVLDSSCRGPSGTPSKAESGAFKLLCAWPGMPAPAQRNVTGFYVSEQSSLGSLYIGHSPDRDAAMLEFVFDE